MNLSTVDTMKHIPHEGLIEIGPNEVKQIQMILIRMLKDVISVCEANNLVYMLCGGSALGAVRHKGFIPWDDDLDIAMPRSSYKSFISLFEENFSRDYWIHTPAHTPDYGLGLARICKKGTKFKTVGDAPEECGIFIDIFIIENAPNNAILRRLHGLGSMAIGFALSCRRFAAYKNQFLSLEADEDTIKVFKTKARAGKFFSFLSVDTWCHMWDKWNSCCRNEQSKYVTIPVGRNHYFKETYSRRVFLPAVRVSFEKLEVNIPCDSDAYLTALYGDYMQIPPDEDHETHVVFEFDLGEYADDQKEALQ